MNIGIYQYSVYNRGGDRMVVQYANHLVSSGHDVTLHVRKLQTVFHLHPLLKIRTVPYPGKLGFILYGVLHHLGHDVVVIAIIHLALFLSRRNRILYFAQADDVEYYENFLPRKCIDILYQRYFASKRPVISMSQHLTDIFQRKYGVAIPHTISTGIDHATFYPDPDPALLKQKGGKTAIFYMHRGDAFRKGHDVAAVVLSMLDRDNAVADNLELWICGNRMNERLLKYPVRNFGIVTDSRLRQLLSSADVFFYPSRHEGFGLFPLEAMACGCAVVTTDAIPYARSAKGILATEIENASALCGSLLELVAGQELLGTLKKHAIYSAGRYNVEDSKKQFEEALMSIIKGPMA